MEVLNVGGKEYVKASVIARELGYTADYVGQLCRGRKVNAKLVGRSWYVDRDSMDLHKTGKYRGSLTKTKEALKDEIRLKIDTSSDSGSNFYRHTAPVSVAYEEDDSELIPVLTSNKKKTGTLSVGLADATSVDVISKNPVYEFDTPKLPTIKFKGALSVSEVEDEVTDVAEVAKEDEVIKTVIKTKEVKSDEPTVSLHPKEVTEFKKKPKNIAISAKLADIKAERDAERSLKTNKIFHSALVKPELQEVVFATEVADSDAPVAHLEVEETEETSSLNLAPVYLSVLTAVCVVLVLIGLEASITFTSQSLSTSYLFGIDHLAASSYSAYDNFESAFNLIKFSTNFFIL